MEKKEEQRRAEIDAFIDEEAAKGHAEPQPMSLETLEKLEDIKGEMRDMIRDEVGGTAETIADLLMTSEKTSVKDLMRMLDEALAKAELRIAEKFPKIPVDKARGDLKAMAVEAAADAVEKRMMSATDDQYTGRLLRLLDEISASDEKAA